MTLPASGAISINSLVGEYGGSTPHSMNEYYKGGSLVLNHSNNANVPTSGTIQLDDFYGQSNAQPFDATLAGTCGSSSAAGGKDTGDFTHKGINTSNIAFLGSAGTHGSWSDQTITNTSGSTSFTVRNFQTVSNNSVGTSVSINIDGDHSSSSSFSALTGWRYVKIGSTTYFDSNDTQSVNYTASGGFTSNFSSTKFNIASANNSNSSNQMPSSGNVTLTLST
jgi:hypothetical protein